MIELKKLVTDFNSLKIKERSGSTFLEIAKCPNYENVWSNILAFYCNPNNEHKLYDLLLNSIFETIGEKITVINFKSIRVITEYSTDLGNRIDIVILADNFVLGIENKIDASLYNDLEDYSNTIEDLAMPFGIPTFKIVLSKNRTNTSNGFSNITYLDLIKNIKKNIGEHTAYSDTKYLIFLIDFLKNIENNINSQSMEGNLEVINFFHNNVEKVNRLLDYHNKFNSDLIQKLDLIDKNVNKKEINLNLENTKKKFRFDGPGRFTWQGAQLIKYNIVINNLSLFFQVLIVDYKICSHFWFSNEKYSYLKSRLEEKGVGETTYEYDNPPENIALEITKQINIIVSVFNNETN